MCQLLDILRAAFQQIAIYRCHQNVMKIICNATFRHMTIQKDAFITIYVIRSVAHDVTGLINL
jgi:hypothetical protein